MGELKAVTIYVRGIATPAGGAYAVLLVCGERLKELAGGEFGTSNNRMDLLAAVVALKSLKQPCRVTLYNPNAYLIEGMSKGWAARWRDAGWTTADGRPTAHSELWDTLLELCAVHEVTFVWLPVEGVAEYGRCGRLARDVIREQVRQVADGRPRAGTEPASRPE